MQPKQMQCQRPNCRAVMTPRVDRQGLHCTACGWVWNTAEFPAPYDPPEFTRKYWAWIKHRREHGQLAEVR